MWSTCTCYGAGGSALVVKNLPSQRDFVLTNREEALIDQLALLAKVSCAAPRRATTTFSTVFVIILAVHRDTIAKGAVPSRLKIDLTNYTQKDSTPSPCGINFSGARRHTATFCRAAS